MIRAAVLIAALIAAPASAVAASFVDLVLIAPSSPDLARAVSARLGATAIEARATTVDGSLDLRAAFASASLSEAVPGLIARVWLDARDADVLAVYIAPAGADRVLARRVPTPNGVDEVAAEQAATIVTTTADLIAQGVSVGEPRVDVIHRLPPPAPLPPSPALPLKARAELAAWGGAERWADDMLVPRAGLAATALFARNDAAWAWGGFVAAGARAPFTSESDAASLRTHGGTVELLGLARRRLHDRVALRIAAGLAFDLRMVSNARVAASREEREIVIGGRMIAGVEFVLSARASLVVAATLDAPFLQSRYFVRAGAESAPAFTPARLRPGALALLAFAF